MHWSGVILIKMLQEIFRLLGQKLIPLDRLKIFIFRAV